MNEAKFNEPECTCDTPHGSENRKCSRCLQQTADRDAWYAKLRRKKRKKVPTWTRVVKFFNLQYDNGPAWKTVWRQRLLSAKLGRPELVETYRLYLTRAGYLKHIDKGLYRVDKRIPPTLSLNACYAKSYPRSKR